MLDRVELEPVRDALAAHARGPHPADVERIRQDPPMEQMLVPLLRGVFHQYSFVASVLASRWVALADGYWSASPLGVRGRSCGDVRCERAYHRFPWRSATAALRARRLDHAMIFVFIAGTYTHSRLVAFTVTARIVGSSPSGRSGVRHLSDLVWIHAPRWISAIAYLGVRWVGLILFPQLFPHSASRSGVVIVVVPCTASAR